MIKKSVKLIKNQKGASLYLAIVIIGIVSAMALGLNTISFKGIAITKELGRSPIALYAADTGIERTIYEEHYGGAGIGDAFSDTLSNGAEYKSEILGPGMGICPAGVYYCVKSVGIYKGTRRAILIVR